MEINTSSNAAHSIEKICTLSQPDAGYIYSGTYSAISTLFRAHQRHG